MKLAVSNIAWCGFEDEAIAQVLSKHGLGMIEAAPAALAKQPTVSITDERVDEVVAWWRERGFSIPAFQALLFGHPEFQLFGSDADRQDLLDFLTHVIGIAEKCEAKHLVFGSPKNRLRNGVSIDVAHDIAAEFFTEAGKVAAQVNSKICLEPNAAGYGCDYLTHLDETAALVRRINSPGIGLQLDTGVLLMNNESVEEVEKAAPFISHVHCSHPYLEAISLDTLEFHQRVADALSGVRYRGIVSIEMKRANDENNEKHITSAVQFAQQAYERIL